jgi:hypothetical protein
MGSLWIVALPPLGIVGSGVKPILIALIYRSLAVTVVAVVAIASATILAIATATIVAIVTAAVNIVSPTVSIPVFIAVPAAFATVISVSVISSIPIPITILPITLAILRLRRCA